MATVYIPPKAMDTYRIFLQSAYDYSIKSTLKLEEKLDFYVEGLAKHAQLCPQLNKYPSLRKCKLTKNISMVYRLVSEERIEVVAFIDTRMNHGFL